jgi:hypothetical protein
MGSTLGRPSVSDPGKIDMIWSPSAGSVVRAIARFGRSIRTLRLPDDIGDDPADDGVRPVALMPDLHLLPGIWSVNIGYEGLVSWLRKRFDLRTVHDLQAAEPLHDVNLVLFPYDWRLSNRYNAERLGEAVRPVWEERLKHPGCGEAKVVFLCHSMGGLIARWYVDICGGADLARKIVTLGTPHRGSLKALDQLVNGVRKGIGWLSIDLTLLARSLPSLHQLLPAYACLEQSDGPLARLARAQHRATAGLPPVATVPELAAVMVEDAMEMYEQLDDARSRSLVPIRPIVGIRQPTLTTARIVGTRVDTVFTIDGDDEWGDATVPRLAAAPKGVSSSSDTLATVADQHGSLQGNKGVLDLIEGALTGTDIEHLGPGDETMCEVGLEVPDLLGPGDEFRVAVTASLAKKPLLLRVFDERNSEICRAALTPTKPDTPRRVLLQAGEPFSAGAYRIELNGATKGSTVRPVTGYTLLLPDTEPEEH